MGGVDGMGEGTESPPGSGPWPPADLIESLRRELDGRTAPVAIILGSGMGGIARALTDAWVRDAARIPGYPRSTVAGHCGRLLWGRLRGREVWVVEGRTHLYEGYTPEEVTRSVRLLHALGARILIQTNAAGSVDRNLRPVSIVLASDAISLFSRPLARSAAEARPGPGAGLIWRRRDLLIDRALFGLAQEAARHRAIALHTGVLCGCLGPSYETAAEIAACRRLGGSVVTMSSVPEAVQARELGMRSLLFSLVTNYATGLAAEPLSH